MNLYKVVGKHTEGTRFPHTRFIVALDERKALKKFIELKLDCRRIDVDFICKRDDIIPTADPIKEFKHD